MRNGLAHFVRVGWQYSGATEFEPHNFFAVHKGSMWEFRTDTPNPKTRTSLFFCCFVWHAYIPCIWGDVSYVFPKQPLPIALCDKQLAKVARMTCIITICKSLHVNIITICKKLSIYAENIFTPFWIFLCSGRGWTFCWHVPGAASHSHWWPQPVRHCCVVAPVTWTLYLLNARAIKTSPE